MRKFTIVGGGQSGLMVAIGLLKAGHQVRVVQNRTGDEIAKGRVLSSQCMFSNAVQHEADLGLDFWSDTCPPVQGSTSSCRTPTGRGPR
jgi:2-polyprenyl-6-methoxyphenol hydroxylase-like FAD-dependent oxidoreductase